MLVDYAKAYVKMLQYMMFLSLLFPLLQMKLRRSLMAEMTVSLIAPIAMEDGLRVAIREGGRTGGAGVVSKVIE